MNRWSATWFVQKTYLILTLNRRIVRIDDSSVVWISDGHGADTDTPTESLQPFSPSGEPVFPFAKFKIKFCTFGAWFPTDRLPATHARLVSGASLCITRDAVVGQIQTLLAPLHSLTGPLSPVPSYWPLPISFCVRKGYACNFGLSASHMALTSCKPHISMSYCRTLSHWLIPKSACSSRVWMVSRVESTVQGYTD